MKTKMENTLKNIKRKIETRLSPNCKRKWIKTNIDSYSDSDNRVSFLVLQGSPPPAFIMILHNSKKIYGFNGNFKKIIEKKVGYI